MNRINHLRSTGRRSLRLVRDRIGANGLAGLGVFVLAFGGFVLAWTTHREALRLEAQVQELHDRAKQLQTQPSAALAPSERLARFQNWFPTTDTATADLRKIFDAAQASHLTLARGEYVLTPIEGSGGLQKFDVVFPVKEHYGAVKNFVADVLNALPHASLAELRVERSGSTSGDINTRVHFTLYYRNPVT